MSRMNKHFVGSVYEPLPGNPPPRAGLPQTVPKHTIRRPQHPYQHVGVCSTSTSLPMRSISGKPIQQNAFAQRLSSLSEVETEFYESVDMSQPFMSNLNKTFQKNYFDLGKLGLVLLKYDKLKYLDVTSYEQSLSYYCNYSVKVLPTVSSLGTLSPQVFQLAQTYMTNLLSHKNALLSKKEDKTPMLICTPSFIHVAQTFKGSHPFKTQVEVSMRGLGQVPNGIQRAISWIIKNVLSQILDDPVAHQQYSVRAMPERNTKTSCKELPFNVLYFIKDYVLSSFGYPPALRFPGYTYQQLAAESPLLASELGATSEECEERFPKLVADADVFDNLVFDKIQRLFNDLRKSVLQETCHVHDNYEYRRCEFVRIDKGT